MVVHPFRALRPRGRGSGTRLADESDAHADIGVFLPVIEHVFPVPVKKLNHKRGTKAINEFPEGIKQVDLNIREERLPKNLRAHVSGVPPHRRLRKRGSTTGSGSPVGTVSYLDR